MLFLASKDKLDCRNILGRIQAIMANWVIQNSEGNAIKLVIEQINSEVKLNEKSIALKLSVYRRQETLSSILEKKAIWAKHLHHGKLHPTVHAEEFVLRVDEIGYGRILRLADNFFMITIFSIILLNKVIVFSFVFYCWDETSGQKVTEGGKFSFRWHVLITAQHEWKLGRTWKSENAIMHLNSH